MKKLLLLVICLTLSNSYAQLPPNSFGEDFTLTDINGNEFNLYSKLDEGKTVILDLFATWCGPCWTYAQTGVLEELEAAYPNDVVVVAVEADPTTAESTIYNSANGNWTTVINYALMDDPSGNVGEDYALSYYPTIYKICPDRMVTEVGQLTSVSAFMNEINSCTSAEYSKDAKIVGYDGPASYCGGQLGASSVMIQNYSLGAPLTTCNVELRVDNEAVYSTTWNGNLSTYQTDYVNIPAQSGINNGSEIAFHVTYPGDMDTDNNGFWPQLSGSTQASNNISLSITTDNWPEETTWDLVNSNGTVVSSGGPYTGQANTVFTEEWDLDPGCYTFNVYDQYGDGVEASMWGTYDDGIVILTDLGSWDGSVSETNLWNGVQYEYQGSTSFEVLPMFNISEQSVFDLSIFPNPFKDFTTISINYSKSNHIHRHMPLDDANISVYNNIGKMVYSESITLTPGLNNIKFEKNDILPGLYYLNVNFDGKDHMRKLNIVK